MSVQDALAFIQELGSRPDLREKLRSLGDRAELSDVVDMGSGEGNSFTVEDLHIAFVRDWSMRRSFFCGEKMTE